MLDPSNPSPASLTQYNEIYRRIVEDNDFDAYDEITGAFAEVLGDKSLSKADRLEVESRHAQVISGAHFLALGKNQFKNYTKEKLMALVNMEFEEVDKLGIKISGTCRLFAAIITLWTNQSLSALEREEVVMKLGKVAKYLEVDLKQAIRKMYIKTKGNA